MDRVTMIMGAGAPLDMKIPKGLVFPSTSSITAEVRKPYTHPLDGHQINVVEEIYQRLMDVFPVNHNLWWVQDNKPYIHFEILFHVMEQLLAYERVWEGQNQNPYRYPYFAPFTKRNFDFNREDLFYVMKPFLMRIMDIVNDYDNYYRNNRGAEQWFAEFFQTDFKWDVFNFNYDTLVEQSLGDYEDGYERVAGDNYCKFSPMRLQANPNGLSTVNHLHGCILYSEKKHANDDLYDTTIHDLYKYPDYATVKDMLMGRGKSNEVSQTNEEYYAGPIITGLRKTDKLSCSPYDFYHGNLYKALYSSPALVVVGYSFGDIYVNNVIRRMHTLYGNKKRVVIIDKWNQQKVDSESDGLAKYIASDINPHEVEQWLMMAERNDLGELYQDFLQKDVTKPMYSQNGCLLLLTDGFKAAVARRDEIVNFLKS